MSLWVGASRKEARVTTWSVKKASSTLTACVLTFALTSACAPQGGKKKVVGSDVFTTECNMDPLQVHSVQGYWEKPPIKISFKNGDWNASEIGAIQAGAKTWNTFFGASKGFAIFDQGPDGTGNTSNSNQAGPTCSGGTLGDGAVIYRRASGWTKSKSAIAVTTTCYRNNTGGNSNGVPILYNAIMEFNYVDFFMSGTKCPSTGASPCVPDIQSIALHELGHLLGLDHACGPLGAPNQSKSYMGCPNAATDPDDPIISTVMFPTVFFDTSGTGEVKQKLTENDQGRANCAYLDF